MTTNAKQSSFLFVNGAYSEVLFTIHHDGRITIANHLTVPTIAQFLKSQDIDVLTDEPDRTVAHCEMDAARML